MHDEQALIRRSTELGHYLLEAGLSVTAAESCTGGWIAKVITDIAGSCWSDRQHRSLSPHRQSVYGTDRYHS